MLPSLFGKMINKNFNQQGNIMYINLKNLCLSDIEKTMADPSIRREIHVLCQPISVFMQEKTNERTEEKYYFVYIHTDSPIDPKIQFRGKEKALSFYHHIVDLIINGQGCVEIDVLEHGAI